MRVTRTTSTVPSPPLPDNQSVPFGERPPNTPPLDSSPPPVYNGRMDTASPEPLSAATHQPKRKLTIEDVRKAKAKGISQRALAAQHGVDRSAIRWLIDKHREQKHDVSEFKTNRGDILAQLQSQSIALQSELMEDLRKDRLLGALKPGQKTGLLIALNSINGTAFDKERLETGQSTANHSIMSKMIASAVADIYKPLIRKGSGSTAPQSGAGSQGAEGSPVEAPILSADVEEGDPGGRGGE